MHLSTRNPRIIELGNPSSRRETTVFYGSLDPFGKKFSTDLDRNRKEMAFLSSRLRESEKPTLRVLQVGIGNTFVGETVNILDALERTGKSYELVCMDSNLGVVLHHALQDEFKAEGAHYHLLELPPEELRKLIRSLACVENIRETRTPDELGIYMDVFNGVRLVDFQFDIPQRILDRITYLIGDIARDSIPAELLGNGFDAMVCLHTLYHIDDLTAVQSAVQNLIRYLSAHGLLAIDTGKGRLHTLYDLCLEELPNMHRVFGPNKGNGGLTDDYFVFEATESSV